jgi:hypothetical protein
MGVLNPLFSSTYTYTYIIHIHIYIYVELKRDLKNTTSHIKVDDSIVLKTYSLLIRKKWSYLHLWIYLYTINLYWFIYTKIHMYIYPHICDIHTLKLNIFQDALLKKNEGGVLFRGSMNHNMNKGGGSNKWIIREAVFWCTVHRTGGSVLIIAPDLHRPSNYLQISRE